MRIGLPTQGFTREVRAAVAVDVSATVLFAVFAALTVPFNSVILRKELGDQLNHPSLRVLLDCKNVRRISTAAVAMLRDFYRWLKPFGSRMALCRIRAEVREIMEVFRMENIPYFHDKKTALLADW